MSVIDDLLQRTSRTFALAIPLLPDPTRRRSFDPRLTSKISAPGLITFNAFIAGLVAPPTSAALGLSNAD
jgi:hypothetical protein